MKAKTYTGIVTNYTGGGGDKRRVELKLDDNRSGTGPAVGTAVELRVVLTDQQIGRRLRAMLTENVSKRSVRELAQDVDGSAGWPVLGELLLAVIDAEDDT